MKNVLKNKKKKLIISVIIGSLITAILLSVSFSLGEYSGSVNIYYIILCLIGPPILVSLNTTSVFVYGFTLFLYYFVLSFVFMISNKKYKKITLGIIILLHLVSVFLGIHIIKSQFSFLDKIDWRSVMQEWRK